MKDKDHFTLWSEAYKKFHKEGTELRWPVETMVRLFNGDYIPGLNKEYQGKKILDVGFGNGNNQLFFSSLGLQMFGTEVSQDICDLISKKLSALDISVDFRVGTNSELPFDDNSFDYLVSWNVLHYEGDREGIIQGLREYKRVLKPGGRLLVSTVGRDNSVFRNSESLSDGKYRLSREDDFRKGKVFYCLESEANADCVFREVFSDVYVGRVTEKLFTEVNDSILITAIK